MAIDNRYNYKSSAEQRTFQKGRDSRVNTIKSYRQVESLPRGSLPRHAPRVYREVDRQVYQVDQAATEAAYQARTYEVDRMVTEADFERRLPSTDDYRLQEILYRACGSTAQSSDSASALEHGKYNHL